MSETEAFMVLIWTHDKKLPAMDRILNLRNVIKAMA